MLNFNTNIQELINAQATTKGTCFTEYNSKKKLLESGILTQDQCGFIQQLKNTFTFYLHNDNKYLLITLYYSKTNSYEFIVVNLETLQYATVPSVKLGKQEILEIIKQEQDENKEEQHEKQVNNEEPKSKKNK